MRTDQSVREPHVEAEAPEEPDKVPESMRRLKRIKPKKLLRNDIL